MYRKKKIKGVSIRWKTGWIFPVYAKTSGPCVSQRRINRLKQVVIDLLAEEEKIILNAFNAFARKRYKGKCVRVHLNMRGAVCRLQNTFVCTGSDIYGISDEKKFGFPRVK